MGRVTPHATPTDPNLNEVARVTIRRWVEATGVSQQAIAERLGRKQGWVSRYLRGDFNADLNTLAAFADLFEHTLASLLAVPTDPVEAELLTLYRAADPGDRRNVIALLHSLTRKRGGGLRSRSDRGSTG
jgi:transcriptional regulator with XRE-family HTH domain